MSYDPGVAPLPVEAGGGYEDGVRMRVALAMGDERKLVAVRDSLDEVEFMEKIALKNGILDRIMYESKEVYQYEKDINGKIIKKSPMEIRKAYLKNIKKYPKLFDEAYVRAFEAYVNAEKARIEKINKNTPNFDDDSSSCCYF